MPRSSIVKTTFTRKQPYRTTKSILTAKLSTSKKKNSKRNSCSAMATSWRAEVDAKSNEPIFFWRPNEAWGVLGQWYDSPFKDGGIDFTCCEQYMMYHKALTFGDDNIAQMVLDTTDPREHKSLGKRVSGFTDHEWNKVKFEIVVRANMLKYGGDVVAHKEDKFVYSPNGQVKGQDSVKLRDLLLRTEDRYLVEASPLDKIWGIGFSPQRAANEPSLRVRWGKNLLGKALMEVRKRLVEETMMADGNDRQ